MNSIFGLGSLGGVNTLYDFVGLLSSNDEEEVETIKMPTEVKEAFENLKDIIF